MRQIKLLPSKKIGKRKYTMALFECPICKKHVSKIKIIGKKAGSCSHKCYALNRNRRGAYKDKIISNEYVYLYCPQHPHAIGTKRLYVAEHRLVMEKIIGRLLNNNEVIHHIDGNKRNNTVQNLLVMSKSEHSLLHSKNKRKKTYGKFTYKV